MDLICSNFKPGANQIYFCAPLDQNKGKKAIFD